MPTAGSRTTGRPMVGREAERDRLVRAVEEVGAGRGGALLVLGDAGIGKTRLLEELEDLASRAELTCHWGRAWRPQDAPDFWPWIQVLRSLTRDRGVDGVLASRHAASIVGRLAPDVVEDAGVAPRGHDPSPFEVLDAIASCVTHAAHDLPTVVLLDDLHDADDASLELLSMLAGQSSSCPLLLVAASRPTSTAALSELAARCDVLSLRGLDAGDVRALAAAGGLDLDTDAAARLETETSGNPFLVLEALATGDPSRGGARAGVRSLTESRLRNVPDELVEVLTAAAVLDDRADEGLLARMLGRDQVELLEDLKELADLGLLVRASDRPTGWTVGHDLLQDALLQRCDEATRRQLAGAAAGAMLDRHGDDPAHAGVIAQHLAAAVPLVPVERAARALRRAADTAAERLGHEEAARHLSTCVGLLRTRADLADLELDALLELGRVQLRGTAPASARSTASEAIGLARRLDDPPRLAQAVLQSCDAARRAPGFDMDAAAVVPDVDDALAALASRPSATAATLRAQLLATRGVHLTMAGSSEALDDVAREAVRAADEAHDPRAVALAALCERGVLDPSTTPAQRAAVTERLLDAARRTGDPELLWRAHHHRLMDALLAADPVAAAAAVDMCLDIATRHHDPNLEGLSLLWQGGLALTQGRFDDHAAITERALTAMQRAEGAGIEHLGGQQVFRARDLGELDASGLDALAEQFPTTPVIQALRVWGHLHAGHHDRADALLDEMARAGLDRLPRNNFWLEVLAMLSEVAARLERRDVAATLLRLLAPLPDQCVLAANSPTAWTGPLTHFTGLLRLATGDVEGAIHDLDRALAVEHRMGARPATARTRTALAVAWSGRDHARATRELLLAHDEATALGMEWLTGEQRAVAERFDIDLARPTPAPAAADRRRRAVLRPGPGGWTIGLDDELATVRATKGLAYLATLVAHPQREVAALELAAGRVAAGSTPGLADDGLPVRLGGGAGPVLDDAAIAAYRARLDELAAGLDEADRLGDVERAAALGAERDALVTQLSAGTGLGGRRRQMSDDAERARLNVTRAIRTAIDRIRAVAPTIADHLDTSVRTGRACSYVPDPTSPITWDLGP